MRSVLQRLAVELGDLTPEELAVVLPDAARRIARAPHWKGGRSDIASLLRAAGRKAQGIAERRATTEAA